MSYVGPPAFKPGDKVTYVQMPTHTAIWHGTVTDNGFMTRDDDGANFIGDAYFTVKDFEVFDAEAGDWKKEVPGHIDPRNAEDAMVQAGHDYIEYSREAARD